MWIERDISARLQALAQKFPAVVLTEARQSGKTSLVRHLFPHYTYVTLDIPSTAALAANSPEEFLARYPTPLLVDEVQYAPELFRHIKVVIDQRRHTMGQFILTGSQKFTLMAHVADSLAGRCALVELATLSVAEIASSGTLLATYAQQVQCLIRGTFPELWRDPDIPSDAFYQSYLATYLERDVRQLLNVGSLRDFERFLRACAVRSGQLLNKSDLSRDVGVSQPTINTWLAVLEASNQIALLEPFFANVGKRLVKSPKLYVLEPGLLCFLLGITPANFETSPFIGMLWESFVFAELRKLQQLLSPQASLFFYRDQQNREVDFLWVSAGYITLMEARWTEHPRREDGATMENVAALFARRQEQPYDVARSVIICRTPESFAWLPQLRVINGFAMHHAWADERALSGA
jgi:predicted AAA+ superfamily ATPase